MSIRSSIVALLAVVFLTSCFQYEDIELKAVHDVKLNSIQDNELDLEIDLELYNPNAYKVKVTKADLDVTLNELYLGNSQLQEIIEIPSESSSKKTVLLKTQLDKEFNNKLPGLLTQAIFSGLNLKVDGKITGKARWLSHTFDVHHEEKISINDLNLSN